MFGKVHHHESNGAQVHHHEAEHHGPQVNVHSHHHGHSLPVHHHRRSYNSAGWGLGSFLIAAVIIIPIFVIASLLKLTVSAVNVAATSMAATGLVGAGAGVASTIAFSTALGVGALAVYGAIGLLYLGCTAKECYSSNKNVFDMIKSQVVNEDGLSFTGALKSAGAVLWSPFLLIGGLTGMGVKAVVQAYRSKFSPSDEYIELEEMSSSHSKMTDLGSKEHNDTSLGQRPMHTSSLFYDPSAEEQTNRLDLTPTFSPLQPH